VKPAGVGNDVYVWAKARILEADAVVPEPLRVPLRAGHAILFDAYTNFQRSGINFATGEIVAWDSGKSDLLVSNMQVREPLAYFFTQGDSAENGAYENSPWDKGSDGGIVKMQGDNLENITEAPASGYLPHWFRAEPNAVYCVRTRDGKHFAKIKVTALEGDRIAFDWLYQTEPTRLLR
jgi:hypothetical protein